MQANPQKIEAYRLLLDAAFQLDRLDDAKKIIADRTEPVENARSEVLMARLTLLADRGESKLLPLSIAVDKVAPTAPPPFSSPLAWPIGNSVRRKLRL